MFKRKKNVVIENVVIENVVIDEVCEIEKIDFPSFDEFLVLQKISKNSQSIKMVKLIGLDSEYYYNHGSDYMKYSKILERSRDDSIKVQIELINNAVEKYYPLSCIGYEDAKKDFIINRQKDIHDRCEKNILV